MAVNDITSFLKYANLQMAAEAILPIDFSGPIPDFELTDGNNRNSRFPTAPATDFANTWRVVDHTLKGPGSIRG